MADYSLTPSVVLNPNTIRQNQNNDPLRPINPLLRNFDPANLGKPDASTLDLQFRPEKRENDVQVETRNDTPFQPTGVQFGDMPSPTMNTGGREISRQEATQMIREGAKPFVRELGRTIASNLSDSTVTTVGAAVGIANTLRTGRVSGNTDVGGVNLSGTLDARNRTAQFGTRSEVVLGGVPLNIQTGVELGRGGKPAGGNINISRDLGRGSGIEFNLNSQGNQRSANISFRANF